MTLAVDLAAHLAAAGLGISLASTATTTSPVVYACPFPEGSPDYSVSVIEYGGLPAIRAMGASTTPPVAEVARFQVCVRHDRDNFGTARTLAESVLTKLDHAVFTSTANSIDYLYVKALAPVAYMGFESGGGGQDGAGRHRFVVNAEAKKRRG